MTYRAIIFDLDGTAIPNVYNPMPSRNIIRAVRAAQKRLHVSAASGRPITNARHILNALGLTDPCVIAAGTQVVDPVTNELLWQERMTKRDAQTVLDICHAYDNEVIIGDELLGQGAPARNRRVTGPVNTLYILGCTPEQGNAIINELAGVSGVAASAVLSWTLSGLDIHVTHSDLIPRPVRHDRPARRHSRLRP